MGNYADLKQHLFTILNRDNLTDQAIVALEATIRRHQKDFYHPTPITTSVDDEGADIETVAGTALYTTPVNLVSISMIRMAYGGNWRILRGPLPYEQLLFWDVNIPATQSLPNTWARHDDQFRIYPVPNDVYALELTGTERIPIPADDDTSNFWTGDAHDMIMYGALSELYQSVIKDDECAMRFASLEATHRNALKKEMVGKTIRGQIAAHW